MSTPPQDQSPERPLQIRVSRQPPHVLLIADITSSPGKEWLDALTFKGYRVTHVGVGSKLFNFYYLPFRQVVRRRTGDIAMYVHEFKIESLLDMLPLKFSYILHVQDGTIPRDVYKLPLPYIFIQTNADIVNVPMGTTMVLIDNSEAFNRIRSMPLSVGHLEYSARACAVPTEITPVDRERSIDVGFMGEIFLTSAPLPRLDTMDLLAEKLGDAFQPHYLGPTVEGQDLRVPMRGNGILTGQAKVDYWSDCKSVLTIPRFQTVGRADLEACLHGAMLVTLPVADHIPMGFEDGVNCRYFDGSPDDALEKCTDYDPAIAEAGQKLVIENHSYKARVDHLGQKVFEITGGQNHGFFVPLHLEDRLRVTPKEGQSK